MKKPKDNELQKDDEILRIQAMEDGPAKFNGLTYRPITALTVSWMQRNNVFSGELDPVWKAAAFTFLHTEPMSSIRSVVNDKDAFVDAVDSWIEKNMAHHYETSKLSEIMSRAFERYSASAPASDEASTGLGSGN